MSTLRINNIEAQSVPASPTIDEKVKVTNSSGDILVNIDGKTSGITTIGINTTDGNIKFDANSNVLITGILTATVSSGIATVNLGGKTDEEIQDIVGAMFSGNTETNITVTYQDSDGTIDLVADQLTTEQVQDIVGGMFSGNTETNITATYQDSDGTIDLEVAGGGKFVSSSSGIHTNSNVGIGTTQFTTAMVGAGNSFQGMYISNGMTIYDNELNGNHYISTNFNGLMAGPVTVNGVLTVDGNYVVV